MRAAQFRPADQVDFIVVGVGAAAEVFFDKPVSQLTLGQEALLAGLPQAPSQYNPYLAPHLALARRADFDLFVGQNLGAADLMDAYCSNHFRLLGINPDFLSKASRS